MSEREILSNYVYTIVASLVQNGVEQVVISPGSRSTPLAYAFAHTKEIEVFRQVDERAAAFFALGLAKRAGKPVVLLCTSGTAAANYFPAIVEAKYARVPLIVITADRPHELREVGAPQAINQIHLYGEQVKWFAEFPIPDDAKPTLPFIERHTARAVAIAMSAPFGPVHLNIPFREPLLVDFCDLPTLRYQGNILNPYSLSDEAKSVLEKRITQSQKGVFIVGELPLNTDVHHLWELIRRAKWPVMVESLSNMRGNVPEDCKPYVISTYDAILKNATFKKAACPDTVIRFGAQPVSKFLSMFITESMPAHYIVVDEDPMFRDSTSTATAFIHAKIDHAFGNLTIESRMEASYLALWQQAQAIAMKHIEHYIEREQDEGALVGKMLQCLPEASDVFASSSMPIRDIDTFYTPSEKDIHIIANRGANGIDGVVSTVFGYSAGNSRHTYLLIGDLAFLHDSNAFLATRYQNCELTIIVMNNDGGGIFSYLPQSSVEHHYEDLFGTPTGLTFEQIAVMYDLHYTKVTEPAAFVEAIYVPNEKPVRLIEVFTNRAENVVTHRKLWQAINEEFDAWLP
ncbi:2-succinyl-5-enolpyruvyl-6-hydroxy-3-cyclohexene-1-carboxylic-acid synthase [Lysinibacillus sp. KU-BSD001]|uniref:2-succinyl-5-enolpyruvyl-6-hydroxy-3- cyclohexene-1-carboxylic-acid synthase n=1 Tax=Lysinibacillus sp. KU-BSD001 TaxID=3141328 RepID=UPI0036F13B4C